jgi:hypothetical protein
MSLPQLSRRGECLVRDFDEGHFVLSSLAGATELNIPESHANPIHVERSTLRD